MLLNIALNFNPRSLTGATIRFFLCPAVSVISIHAPSRERPFGSRNLAPVILFQSTLPHGSDNILCRLWQAVKLISIHAPSRERPVFSIVIAATLLFQSTLPHGSDVVRLCASGRIVTISIHAPSRERPPLPPPTYTVRVISIHAPSRERPSVILLNSLS